MTTDRYRIAAVQLNSGEDPARNLVECGELIAQAAAQHAAIVVLPELFNCFGSWEAISAHAEPLDGPTHDWLCGEARRHGIWLIGGSFCERPAGSAKAFNTSLLIDPTGTVQAVYRKLHLFDASVAGQATACESNWLAAGSTAVSTSTPYGRLAQAICYDLRFGPLFTHYAEQPCELIALPAAFTAKTGAVHWEVLLRARAIETQAYVIAANQVGTHHGTFSTYGHSLIVDPWGVVLADAGNEPGVALAEVDLAHLRDIRTRLPVSAHRRAIH